MPVPVGLNVWSRLTEDTFPYLDRTAGSFDSLWFPDHVQYGGHKVAEGWTLLAYALARGDRSVLTGAEDERAVRLLAQAVQRPAKFWEWVASQPCGEVRRHAITRAERLGAGDRPHDHSVIQAAAYLASSAPLPQTPEAAPAPGPFPYWAVLDRHTAAGKRALPGSRQGSARMTRRLV